MITATGHQLPSPTRTLAICALTLICLALPARAGVTNAESDLPDDRSALRAPHSALATVPAAEKILPDDTLVLVTTPDFTKLIAIAKKSPQFQLWNDPAMKPFRDNFMAKFKTELLEPLDRELGVNLEDYGGLPVGQVTFAVTRNGWHGTGKAQPAALLLADVGTNAAQLKTTLVTLRKKWTESGKLVRTEKIHGVDFMAIPLSSNAIPKAIREFLPDQSEGDDAAVADDSPQPDKTPRTELMVGQVDSLLIVGSGAGPVEQVLRRLTGGSAPSLGELRTYQADQVKFFRDAAVYGWVNVKVAVDALLRKPAPAATPAGDGSDQADDASPETAPAATPAALAMSGLTGVKTLAFSLSDSHEGMLAQFFVGAPESQRQGLFKILAAEARDASVPSFVPADVVKFQRWRLDGQKAWASLEQTLKSMSPVWLNTINYLIDAANLTVRQRDPGFDLRKNLIGNLGDDIINYEKAPHGTTDEDLNSAPSIYLIGSPAADRMAAAVNGLLTVLSTQGMPEEREFLGRKIYSVTVPSVPMGMPAPGQPVTRTLSVSASGGYVALATDASLLEEFLRSSESRAKALREMPGVAEAAARVTNPGTGLFGFENDATMAKILFEARSHDTNAMRGFTFMPMPGVPDMPPTRKSFRSWMDYRLLPDFDRISRYFYFSVYGGAATADGLTVKMFSPTPPLLR
jgi:hypothetical protein